MISKRTSSNRLQDKAKTTLNMIWTSTLFSSYSLYNLRFKNHSPAQPSKHNDPTTITPSYVALPQPIWTTLLWFALLGLHINLCTLCFLQYKAIKLHISASIISQYSNNNWRFTMNSPTSLKNINLLRFDFCSNLFVWYWYWKLFYFFWLLELVFA